MHRDNLLQALNDSASILLSTKDEEDIGIALSKSLASVGNVVKVHRVHIWNNVAFESSLMFQHTYEWSSDSAKDFAPVPIGIISPFGSKTTWENRFKKKLHVSLTYSKATKEEQAELDAFGLKSLLIIPIHIGETLWGLFTLDDCMNERTFTDDEISILHSFGFMIASAMERHALAKKNKESTERMMLMLDASPICTQIWNTDLETIDCNEAAVKLYGFKDKNEYKERFIQSCSPEYQPDGQRSDEKAIMLVNKAFKDGYCRFDWTHQMPDGSKMIPGDITLIRSKYGEMDVVLGYTRVKED
jgi:PAS domain-containing protein